MNSHGYPSRLYWYIAAVLGVGLPVAAGAVVGVALDPPDASTGVGVILFFGLALLADMKPVPLDVENERVVSLAFVFVVSSQILFGWEYAVLSAILGVLLSQMVERRPLMRSFFNAAVYGLAAFCVRRARLPPRRLDRARHDHLLRLRRRRRVRDRERRARLRRARHPLGPDGSCRSRARTSAIPARRS